MTHEAKAKAITRKAKAKDYRNCPRGSSRPRTCPRGLHHWLQFSLNYNCHLPREAWSMDLSSASKRTRSGNLSVTVCAMKCSNDSRRSGDRSSSNCTHRHTQTNTHTHTHTDRDTHIDTDTCKHIHRQT